MRDQGRFAYGPEMVGMSNVLWYKYVPYFTVVLVPTYFTLSPARLSIRDGACMHLPQGTAKFLHSTHLLRP